MFDGIGISKRVQFFAMELEWEKDAEELLT
jgi:hypothetical protein